MNRLGLLLLRDVLISSRGLNNPEMLFGHGVAYTEIAGVRLVPVLLIFNKGWAAVRSVLEIYNSRMSMLGRWLLRNVLISSRSLIILGVLVCHG